MLDEKFLQRLHAMQMRMRNPTAGGAGGLRRSQALGSSVEFSDFREYTSGDDLRRVDWNAFARFDKLFLKLFMEEQEAHIHLMVDASASMAFGEPTKWDTSVMLAETLAYLALLGNDRVTLYALAGRESTSTRPLSGRQGYLNAAQFLEGITPKGETMLSTSVSRTVLSPGRGMCILISDFLTPDGYQEALSSLQYRKQEVVALQVLCGQELEPELEEAVRLVDSETGEALELAANYTSLKQYRTALLQYLEELRGFCHRQSMSYGLLQAEEDFEKTILRQLSRLGLVV